MQIVYKHWLTLSIISIILIDCLAISTWSQVSAVGTATSYEPDDRGVKVLVSVSSGTQPASYQMGTGENLPGLEADYSLPISAGVKKIWIYTYTPIRLDGVVLN
jgi:hypothetical protein